MFHSSDLVLRMRVISVLTLAIYVTIKQQGDLLKVLQYDLTRYNPLLDGCLWRSPENIKCSKKYNAVQS